jgi:vacuolar-type H+-ATPase subunit E/Vma4
MLKECEKEYKKIMEEACAHREAIFDTKLTIVQDKWLTPEQNGSCGGVILMAHGRRIVVANTLEDRLALCFEKELPNIRSMLFNPKEDGTL